MHIRLATASDADVIAQLMIKVFDEDPLMNWFFRKDNKRAQGQKVFYDFVIKSYCLPQHLSWVTDDLQGAALWIPSEKWEPGFLMQISMASVIIRAFGLRNSLMKLRERQKIDTRHPKQAHYYLSCLGVNRDLRGRGIGTALLEPMLYRSDNEGRGCYLETTLERSVSFYQRFGFSVTETLLIGPEKIKVWLMWRNPIKS